MQRIRAYLPFKKQIGLFVSSLACHACEKQECHTHVITWLQVSHHPPVGAAHAENRDWEYDMVSAPTTKFLGNSIDIYPIGALALLARYS